MGQETETSLSPPASSGNRMGIRIGAFTERTMTGSRSLCHGSSLFPFRDSAASSMPIPRRRASFVSGRAICFLPDMS